MDGSSKAVILGALITGVVACGNKSTPAPQKDPAPSPAPTASASTSAAAAVSAAPPPGPKTIPTFTLEKFAPAGTKPSALFAVEGALMVVEDQRVGRVNGDTIEWVGRIPSGSDTLGPNRLRSVIGYWPDGIGALYVSSQDRAPEPTYWPVTGKGQKLGTGAGGTRGEILGVAHVGESTVAAWYTYMGTAEISTIRGPALPRKFTGEVEGGCKPGEVHNLDESSKGIAVWPAKMESTPAGTLVSVGERCERNNEPVAEIWDKDQKKSRIVDLTRFWKSGRIHPTMVKGLGDELFIHGGRWEPVVRYHDGAFEAVPPLPGPIEEIFSSPAGQLHGFNGRVIFRWEGGKWLAVGRLAEKKEAKYLPILAVDDKGTFWFSDEGVFRLREDPGKAAEAAPDEETCKAWFVYLYHVSYTIQPQFTFPTTRKALQSFPQAADISLVDITESRYTRYLGVTATSKAQGEAVIAHVKANMKDEDPRLFCWDPPQNARRIDLNAK